ncbi:hypothetical protein BM221_007100 [Beauveria bassiana]|uniref:Uncharacterized protein n=1 Tax=Beauveria bassiana TaxID=176275 RepID=A0A2N6NJI6_BEABA|nr:hypothetical protein BM221_007100 [Beauveria bassiana]
METWMKRSVLSARSLLIYKSGSGAVMMDSPQNAQVRSQGGWRVAGFGWLVRNQSEGMHMRGSLNDWSSAHHIYVLCRTMQSHAVCREYVTFGVTFTSLSGLDFRTHGNV